MIEVVGKQIASDKITIKDCFGEDMWFSVPDYQRPYVWGEDQISSILDDIAYAAINTPDTQYFLGSLVLHCEEKQLNGTSFIENSVLDGQQRLTTLYMLQAVIRDLTNIPKRKQTCSEAIFQEGNPDDGIPERLRIEFAIRKEVEVFINNYIKLDGGTLKSYELKDLSEKSENVSIRNMANALLLIHKWFANDDNLDIDTFFPYLRKYVILIYVASSELEDAFRLFTVLNDRGIKLRNSDILKAQNLKEVDDPVKQKEYAIFWEELEGELGEDFDLFLSYIRTILVKEKARYNLLKEFEDNIYNPKSYSTVTKRQERTPPLLTKGNETFEMIKRYKKHYDKIFDGNNFNLTNSWAFDNLISVLNDTALSDIWVPPLLVYRDKFGDYKILDFLMMLDKKFSGDWVARETPTKRIEAMNNIIKEIENYANTEGTKDERINGLLVSSVFDFNKFDFFQEVENSSIYGRRFARYVLRKMDFLIDAPLYSERRNSYREITVEHILPQNPAEDSQWITDFTDIDREEWTHKLGNLVLISKRKNIQQGRLDYILKKDRYFSSSIETFPNSIRVMQNRSWSLGDLKDNHNKLVGLLKNYYR